MPNRGGSLDDAGNWNVNTGMQIPADLVVNSRTGNQPGVYNASSSITFDDGFESGEADTFDAWVVAADGGSGNGSGSGGTATTGGYRYGFNGKENDNEMKGEGNQQDYGMRIYDPRLGRFLSVDPITAQYPELTPYQFASNRPIDGIDQDGLEYLTYKIKIDLDAGTMQRSMIWNNPEQHSDYGKRGPGVFYDISITKWNSWTETLDAKSIQTMVARAALVAVIRFKSEYGNYLGATSLFKVGKDGKFTTKYDYDLPAVDAADNYAKLHDQGYDRVGAVGATGLFDDWGTTPYDEAAMNGLGNLLDNYKVGDKDPFNGQPVTKGERSIAWNGKTSFGEIIKGKKDAIFAFMFKNYTKEATGIGIEGNYQLFLKKYMQQDGDGNWIRRENMWTKDKKGNWQPVPSKKEDKLIFMLKNILILFVIVSNWFIVGCNSIYKAGNLVDLDYPIQTPLNSTLIRQYLDTLIQKRGYAVPAKWEYYNKLVDLDSVYNKRIYFKQGPEEMYLVSFGGMLVLSDVYNPTIREDEYVALRSLMSPKEEQRVKNRFQHEILDTIEAMAKRDGLPDSIIYVSGIK
ncbi:RHS repeat-associated core domain-containing protein [Chitinophaga sp. Hz27]|uniref:RHS repeat-associated core domain-containing protein n=1 Tax=Chitinophaga sp. Hz27 TaxID=3347169 RepID=UPI0035D93847